MTIKEVQLDYTLNTLVGLMKDKWGDNAVEAFAGLLSTVVTDSQLKVLIDNLRDEVAA
jgi:hypothetical protein